MQVVITKPCYVACAPQAPGTVVDVSYGLAMELIQNAKARRHVQADALAPASAAPAAQAAPARTQARASRAATATAQKETTP